MVSPIIETPVQNLATSFDTTNIIKPIKRLNDPMSFLRLKITKETPVHKAKAGKIIGE